MKYAYEICSSVDEINRADWEKVVQNSSSYVYLSYKFISTIEKSLGQISKFWYVIFYCNETPVACTVYSSFPIDICTVSGKIVKRCINFIRKLYPSFLKFNTLFCGTPVSVGQKPFICVDEEHLSSIVPLVDKLMGEIAKKEKALLNLYKELSEEDCNHFNVLLENKYICAESLPMHLFDHKFSNFSNYFDSLKSSYRNSVKRAHKRFDKKGLKILQTNDVKTILRLYTPEVHNLYLAVVGKSENKLEILPQSFFMNLVIHFPNQVFFTFAIDQNENVVGFNCSLYNNNVFYFIFCGMDYDINYESNLYYNLIYSSLDQAFQLNPDIIQVGQTTDDFKARLGCHSVPLYIYIKFNLALPNFILKKLAKYLFIHREIKTHNVLKTMEAEKEKVMQDNSELKQTSI